ncbi:MAG: hypothetical protein NC084_12285 [Bacteroides sp.]|nr:hypothetical protein [Eubacterium sp.]MCM1419543.1 hypothetical protein [Roseburia sp.]MCM1463471.1 hypothetical protein [Bacteroides sp.]
MKKAISVLLTLALLGGLCGCASSKYSEAKELMDQGEYSAAKEILLEISDYEDSGELVRECDYNTAAKLIEDKEYTKARDVLLQISDYKDSESLIKNCKLNIFYKEQMVGTWRMNTFLVDDKVGSSYDGRTVLNDDFTYSMNIVDTMIDSGECYFAYPNEEEDSASWGAVRFDNKTGTTCAVVDGELIAIFINGKNSLAGKFTRSST